ncbi:MAG: Radical SAM superfamily enzyme YgiQ, UPF0313 family [Pelagibacterales bacterium]|nr:Radical SAM superfamily enzyme YgiQ, UPF0313 family [Pelagibacterales bacterium]
MKVLFLYPLWTGESKGISAYFAKRAGGTYIPYNLALLAAITEKEGHHAKIIDGELEKISLQEIVEQSKNYNPDVIVLTGMTPFYNIAVECAALLKKNHITADICVGGPHITIMEEKAFNSEFNFGFVGAGEEAWKKFLKAKEKKISFSEVPGLLYRENNELKKNKKASQSKDLDQYPMAAYHLLKMGKYKIGTLKGRLPFTSIQTFRGCPWKCIFCASDQLETTKILKRSIVSIVDEMQHVVEKYDIRHFMVLDDVLTLVRKRTVEFCNEIIRRDLKITFEGNTRANLLDEDLVVLMKQAGLIRLSFGLETVDEDMRETMNKKVPLDCYKTSNALLNKYKIEALNSVMLGLPGETEENIWKTLNFLSKSKEVKQANFAIATPYPGTKFHEMAKAGEGGMELLSDDFTEYKRYGQAVTRVNNLGPQDLIRLQNEGFVSIYSKYWRWLPVIKKHGIIGLVLTFFRIFKMVKDKINYNFKKVRI